MTRPIIQGGMLAFPFICIFVSLSAALFALGCNFAVAGIVESLIHFARRFKND